MDKPNRLAYVSAYIDQNELNKRKKELKRGQTNAFKHAVAEAVLYWRHNFAPRHFTKKAHQRYNHPHVWYASEESNTSKAGGSLQTNGFNLTPPYSIKEAMLAIDDRQPHKLPIVFSGETRQGILKGPFEVTGSANSVKGKWKSDKVNWAALAARGNELARHLLVTPPAEQKALLNMIDNNFLPKYLKKWERNEHIPGRLRLVSRNGNFTFG